MKFSNALGPMMLAMAKPRFITIEITAEYRKPDQKPCGEATCGRPTMISPICTV